MCRYKLPKELSEFKLVCAAVQKPLFLLALLHSLQGQSTIVFTASVEATHRCAVITATCLSVCVVLYPLSLPNKVLGQNGILLPEEKMR